MEPQIREVLLDEGFEENLNVFELKVWQAFKWLCGSFLGNHKSPAYKDRVQKLLDAYQKMGCCMSLKLHFILFFTFTSTFPSRKPWRGE